MEVGQDETGMDQIVLAFGLIPRDVRQPEFDIGYLLSGRFLSCHFDHDLVNFISQTFAFWLVIILL